MNERYVAPEVATRRKCLYQTGDILRHADRPENPLEVFCACELPHRDWVVFVMDKRTLLGAFLYDDDDLLTLVRRPDKRAAAESASSNKKRAGSFGGTVRPKYG